MSATGESSSVSFSSASEAFAFTSGNPRIEETRGLMHLFRQDPNLPVDRKPLVCVYGVQNHMTYADFCQFCGSFLQHVLEMRTVRNDGVEDKYSILMSFDSQDSADGFYKHFNGRRYSSLEEKSCQVLFTVDIQYTGGSFANAQASSTASSIEHPSCPVCLERLDQDSGGILTTICNHSFHCSCILKWTDSSCPVCRYCQQQPEKSICFICETSENLWICAICGFVGCGRYKEGHAITHWKETQHCYSLELETKRVWDYVGDNYVHRLIQSKTDGKLIELNSPHCAHDADGCGSCECSEDSEISKALLKSRVDAIVNEYNELLTTQLENQKIYFESLLHEVNKETERQIFEAVDRAVALKLQKMQAKLDKCIEEKKFLDDINENLLRNQGIWKAKVMEAEEREKRTLKQLKDRIKELEEQLRHLMLQMEVGSAINEPSVVLKIQEDEVQKDESTQGSSRPTNLYLHHGIYLGQAHKEARKSRDLRLRFTDKIREDEVLKDGISQGSSRPTNLHLHHGIYPGQARKEASKSRNPGPLRFGDKI